jgi:hypothetical protein
MSLTTNNQSASEAYVNRKINELREDMEKSFEKVDTKAEERYSKLMDQLVSIVSQFKKTEKVVFKSS